MQTAGLVVEESDDENKSAPIPNIPINTELEPQSDSPENEIIIKDDIIANNVLLMAQINEQLKNTNIEQKTISIEIENTENEEIKEIEEQKDNKTSSETSIKDNENASSELYTVSVDTNTNTTEIEPPTTRQSMSPSNTSPIHPSSSPTNDESFHQMFIPTNNHPLSTNTNTITNEMKERSVLIIPLDNRVTPMMVARKFIKYGDIIEVRPILRSSSCIVIFSTADEAHTCIKLFATHDKVRVTFADEMDWNMCSQYIIQPKLSSHSKTLETKIDKNEKSDLNENNDLNENKVQSDKSKIFYEEQQSRLSLLHKQQHSYSMLYENDEIEHRKRIKKNKLMVERIECMFITAKELNVFLIKMIEFEIDHETNIHNFFQKNSSNSLPIIFGSKENGNSSLYSTGIAINSLLKNRYKQFTDINEHVFQNVLESSAAYVEKLRVQLEYFQKFSSEMNKKIIKQKKILCEEWKAYHYILHQTLKLQNIHSENISKKSGIISKKPGIISNKSGMLKSEKVEIFQIPKLTHDPFLNGKSYDICQRKYKKCLLEYNEQSHNLYLELIIADKHRIEDIKLILVDYFLAQKAKILNHSKLVESSLVYIKNINKESDAYDFVQQFGGISEYTAIHASNNEQKHDENEGRKQMKDNLPLNAESNLNSETYVKEDSFSIHSRELSTLIYSDVVRWGKLCRQGRWIQSNWKPIHVVVSRFGFFHVFNHKLDAKAEFSIYLRSEGISVVMKQHSESREYSFEISVPNSSWTSWSNSPSVYVYKCERFQDCKDWVFTIRKYLVEKSGKKNKSGK